VDPRDHSAWANAIKPETRLLFGEVLGNPGLDVLDIEKVSEIAHANHLPLLVDATFTTPYLLKPFDFGADLIFHSATKFLSGHGTVVGGIVVDSGQFDWRASSKFPELSEEYPGFHGMNFSDESTVAAFLLRARREGLRDFGACLSPMSSFQILQGIETLGLRMQRHVENTRQVLAFLSEKMTERGSSGAASEVESVIHPELSSHPDHELATRMLPKGCSSVFTFNLRGGRAAGKRFIEALNVFSHLANVGDAKSLVIHPASTTHYRMSDEDLALSGIHPGTIRLSIGLEDPKDLIDDIKKGLSAAASTTMTTKA
jgi:O-acetylhomoserine (thiol)-lyase